MSASRSRRVEATELTVDRSRDRDPADVNTPSVRLYGYSPGVANLQIFGQLKTPAAPPAYACAYLSDGDLAWLHRAIEERLRDRGYNLREIRAMSAAAELETDEASP